MKYLVTGSAGFIGFHLTKRLLREGNEVISLDNINDYYDVNLKFSRLENLFEDPKWGSKRIQTLAQSIPSSHESLYMDIKGKFTFYKTDLEDKASLDKIFEKEKPQVVIHLAAQAGVRYSITNPDVYISSNLTGFSNMLDVCKENKIEHLVYASSSSVYGSNTKMPFSEKDPVDHPLSLYAATKKSNEMLAHSYSNIFGLPTTGLRFFTVYGPWGRTDMSLFLFTKAILAGDKIDVFNNGNHKRDFTYIDDIVDGVIKASHATAAVDESWTGSRPSYSSSLAPWKVFNIANGNSIPLMKFIELIENKLNKKAVTKMLPMQAGDVPETHADISLLSSETGYKPSTTIEEGVNNFIDWYLSFYNKS